MGNFMAWIKPDRIVTRNVPFDWDSLACRIWYVRCAKTQKWYKAYSERSAGRTVLCEDKPFPHVQAYIGQKKRDENHYGVKLETVDV